MNDSHSTIKAFRAEWKINEKLSIDCYEFPDGEKRIGITGASLAIGRSKEYLGRLSKRGAKVLKSLQDKGYTGWQKECQVNNERGATRAKTISKRDFVKLITWDATVNKNLSSIVILAAIAETGVDAILENLFKGTLDNSFQEKIIHYTKWTNEDLQVALNANYDDWQIIETQELYLTGKY